MSQLTERLAALRQQGEGALIAYLVAGDPDLERSYAYFHALIAGGVDVIELGVPFSDPIADGPAIQMAGRRALQAKINLESIFSLVKRLRTTSSVPIVLMSYYNPIFRFGQGLFLKRCLDEGVSGVIVPDLPIEEAGSYLEIARRYRTDTIFLATPETSDARLTPIIEQSRGFLYLVSRYGTTGARAALDPRVERLIAHARLQIQDRLPLAVGFGISSPEQIGAVIGAGAQGAIVGSALVERVAQLQPPEEISAFVQQLKSATRLSIRLTTESDAGPLGAGQESPKGKPVL
jgi:tryptophan synthase alpha chain